MGSRPGSLAHDLCALAELHNLWVSVFSYVEWANNSTCFLELLWVLHEVIHTCKALVTAPGTRETLQVSHCGKWW